MRGKAYGSDEAENWPQRETEVEGGGGGEKPQRRKGRDGVRLKRKESERKEKQQESLNEAEHTGIVAANSECYCTGLALGCPSKSGVCLIHYELELFSQ